MNWKLVSSKIVFDNFMRIEERTYRLPDGTTKAMYIKLTRPAVCILALTPDNKVIITEQYRPGPEALLQELPGGYIDAGETPEQAAARELREETGYEGKLTLVTECLDDAYSTMRRTCFVATGCVRTANQQLDDSEFIRLKLLGLDEFVALVRSGQMTDVEVALLGLDYLGLIPKR